MPSIDRFLRALPVVLALLPATSPTLAMGQAESWMRSEGYEPGWNDATQRAVFVGIAPVSVAPDQPDYLTQRAQAAEEAIADARRQAAEWLGARIAASIDRQTDLKRFTGSEMAGALDAGRRSGFIADERLDQVTRVSAEAALAGCVALQTFEDVDDRGAGIEAVVAVSPKFASWIMSGGSIGGERGPRGTPLPEWFESLSPAELSRSYGTRFVADEQGRIHLVAFGHEPVPQPADPGLADGARDAASSQAILHASLALAARLESDALCAAMANARRGSALPPSQSSVKSFRSSVQDRAALTARGLHALGTRTITDPTSRQPLCVAACDVLLGSAPGQTPAPAARVGGCPPVPDRMRAATRQVQAEGRGATEEAAIAAALKAAIDREGVQVEASGLLRKQYDAARERVNGEVKQKASAYTRQDTTVRTFSTGFVHSFEVVARQPVDGVQQVTICANLVRFDPKDPRFGLPPTVAVVSLTGRPGTVEVAHRMEAPGACLRLAESALESTLRASGRYMLIDDRLRPVLQKVRRDMADRAARGQVDEQELIKLGRELTADFLLVVELDRAEFSGAAGPRPNVTPDDTASAALSGRLVNVADGSVAWSGTANEMLSQRDLWMAWNRNPEHPEETRLSPIEVAMSRASVRLAESLRLEGLGGTPASAPVRLLGVSRGPSREIRLDGTHPSVKPGARFAVENLVRVDLPDGRSEIERDRVAVLEVTTVQGGVATAKVVEGDADLIEASICEVVPLAK